MDPQMPTVDMSQQLPTAQRGIKRRRVDGVEEGVLGAAADDVGLAPKRRRAQTGSDVASAEQVAWIHSTDLEPVAAVLPKRVRAAMIDQDLVMLDKILGVARDGMAGGVAWTSGSRDEFITPGCTFIVQGIQYDEQCRAREPPGYFLVDITVPKNVAFSKECLDKIQALDPRHIRDMMVIPRSLETGELRNALCLRLYSYRWPPPPTVVAVEHLMVIHQTSVTEGNIPEPTHSSESGRFDEIVKLWNYFRGQK